MAAAEIVGFTGARGGMTEYQLTEVQNFFARVRPTEFHHGDCTGADAQAHRIARLMTPCKIVVHPPLDVAKRAYCEGDIILPPGEYLRRNHDIVDACQLLIATPRTMYNVLRSGTWATIRYAKKIGRPVEIFYPNDPNV
jgi:hypothetical protein